MIPSNFSSIMLFKIFVVFGDKRGQTFVVLSPIIPYYVTYDLDFDMMRWRLSRSTVPLLTLIINY